MTAKDTRLARVARAQAQQSQRRRTTPARLEVPDVITFVTSADFLNRPNLYPGQALLLKVIFLALELLTPWDYAVLDAWGRGFSPVGNPGDRHYEGGEGMPPDVLDRMKTCRGQDRRWFREVVLVVGRRGGKGYVGALAAAYVTSCYLALGDPQEYYSIDRTKRLTGLVFAGQHDQAAKNLFRDLAKVIETAPCFAPYLAASSTYALHLFTPRDLAEADLSATTAAASASLALEACASTNLSGRGPTGFFTVFDELAHLGVETARSGDEVYDAATPALQQFGVDGFILQASTPASQLGKFFASHKAAVALDDDDVARDPTMLTLQLSSWGLYEGWELTNSAEGLPMFPGGPNFAPLTRGIVTYNDDLQSRERADSSMFAVEYRAQWRTSRSAFLEPAQVERIFAPYDGELLQLQTTSVLDRRYVMHVDPAKNRANFAIVIGHAGAYNGDRLRSVIYDAIHVRRPRDYPDGQIDQVECYQLIQSLILAFHPTIVSFDQHNSALSIDMLRQWSGEQHLPVHPDIYEQTATAKHNRETTELFQSAVGLGLVHCPQHDLARMELLHLQERHGKVGPPTHGPVQTSDITDAMFEVAYQLLSGDITRCLQLGSLEVHGSQAGGFPVYAASPKNNPPHLKFPNPSAYGARPRYGQPARGRQWR